LQHNKTLTDMMAQFVRFSEVEKESVLGLLDY